MIEVFMPKSLKIAIITFMTTVFLFIGAYKIFSINHFYLFINGNSMAPQMMDGDVVIFEKKDTYEVNDIAVFGLSEDWAKIWKGNSTDKLVKRIAMIPGQTLEWDGTTWYRDGIDFSSITSGECDIEPMTYKLKDNELFVIGDTETSRTLDSRTAFCEGADFTVSFDDVDNVGTIKKIL